jgi:5'-nucleotidase
MLKGVAKQMLKIKSLFITTVVILLLVFLPLLTAGANEDEVTLTIIHVNDQHGRMGANPYVSEIAKNTNGNVLILDAGDTLHGQTAAILTQGEAMAEIMNAVGYSAMALGNHDFNYGLERLLEFNALGILNFPILSANIKNLDGTPLFQQYVVFPMDVIKVGVFGITTPETVFSTDPRFTEGLFFDDPKTIATEMVEILKADGCDIIIALTHIGIDEKSESINRADMLADVHGIDIIIDGHSHTVLDNGLMIGDTLIAQAGQHGWYIGIVEITITNGTVNKTARLIEVNDDLVADENIVKLIEFWDNEINNLTSKIVGHTPVFLDGERQSVRTGETNLSNLITDSMRWATGAEIALLNGGAIRDSIPAGDITLRHLLDVLPFSNILVTVDITGLQLLSALEHGLSEYPEQAGQFIHVSGINVTFDPSAKVGNRVKSATLENGSKIDPNKTYTVATIEFLAYGGDGFDLMPSDGMLVYFGSDEEAFTAYLQTNPNIQSKPNGRVIKILDNSGSLPGELLIFAGVGIFIVITVANVLIGQRKEERENRTGK